MTYTKESDVLKKLLSLSAGVLMIGALMAGGPAVADESVALPDSAKLVQFNGADVVVSSRDLSAEEIAQVSEAQSAESIDNAVEILNGGESDGLHGQVVFDADSPGEYTAAVLVNSSDVVAFGSSPPGTQCKTERRAGVSTHLIQTKQTYFAYCGNGTWTGSRGQMTKFRTYAGTSALVGTSSTSWTLCPQNTECSADQPFTLKYVKYSS